MALSRREAIGLCVRSADRSLLTRRLVLACALAEGGRGLNTDARRPANPEDDFRYWSPPDPYDVSFGLFQKNLRWTVEYQVECAGRGIAPGDWPGQAVIERIGAAYLDPEHAAEVAVQDLLAARARPSSSGDDLKTLYLYNWPAGNGKPYSPDHATNYASALAEADEILASYQEEPTPVPNQAQTWNPNIPVILQRTDYGCAAVTMAQILNSVGKPTTEAGAIALLGPSRISAASGLLDATGAGMVACLAEQGLQATNDGTLTWAEAVALAGRYPSGFGGRRWGEYGHWSFCNGKDNQGRLTFVNSAADYLSVMDQAQFEARGPWSAVWLPLESPTAPVPPPEVDLLRAEVARLKAELDRARTVIGYLTHEVPTDLRAAVAAVAAVADTLERHAQ